MSTATLDAPASTDTSPNAAPAAPEWEKAGAPSGAGLNNLFDELTELQSAGKLPSEGDPKKAAPAKTPAKTPQESDTPEEETKEDTVEDLDKPKEQPKADETLETKADDPAKAADEETNPSAKYQTAKPLREAYNKLTTEHKALKREVEALKTAKPAAKEDATALSAELERVQKRNAELEETVKLVNYEKSTEFEDKYRKPLMTAYQRAHQKIAEMRITNDDGSVRQGTAEDFEKLLRLPEQDAWEQADAWFGKAAGSVMAFRQKISEQVFEANEALKVQKAQASELEKRQIAQRTQKTQHQQQIWSQSNQEISEKFPQYFKPRADDPDGNKLLETGYKLADTAFSNGEGVEPDEMVKLHAWARNRAASFGRVALDLKRAQTKISELESELKEYFEAEPKAGDKRPGAKVEKRSPTQQLSDELAELDRKG